MGGKIHCDTGDIRDQIMLLAIPCQFCPILASSVHVCR